MSDLRSQLQAIYDEHGALTPVLVVDEARDESHPLHNRFEWDNSLAGEAYRRDQARQMIRSARVIYREATEKEGARTMRAFHSIRTDEGSVYKPTDEIAGDELLSKLLLGEMEREWKQLFRKFGQFEEFLAMVRGDLGDEEAA